MTSIDITGLDPAEVLVALFEATVERGMGADDEDLVTPCTFCDGDGVTACDDPIQCLDPRCTGETCTCSACDGRGYDQRIW